MKLKFYRPRQFRAFMRPSNRRHKYRRYVIMLIICLLLTFILNALYRTFNPTGSNDFTLMSDGQIIPYYLIEKNYMELAPLSVEDINDLWSAKEAFKNTRNSINHHKVINFNMRPQDDLNKSKYIIYEFTKFNRKTKYCQLFDDNDLYANHDAISQIYLNECPVKNCLFTCNKDFIEKSDAILFNEFDLRDSLNNHRIDELPSNLKRNQKQLWILWNTHEAQLSALEYDSYKFNWTISYRQDSEVSDCSNGCIFGTKQYTQVKELNAIKSHQTLMLSEFERRVNTITFLVNDECINEYPIRFASSLNYFVSYKGKCKNPKQDSATDLYKKYLGKLQVSCDYGSLCEKDSLINTKFLFIYQSVNCTDYIKNIFWRALDFGIIPIVVYPEKIYYEKLAPRNSYIHLEDFDFDSKKLSEHLNLVSMNFSMYLNYFKWKFYLNTVSDSINIEKRLMCELCYKLNTEKSIIYYDSILKWFNSDCKRN